MRCRLLLGSLSVAQSKQQFGRPHLLCVAVLQLRRLWPRAPPIGELATRFVCVAAAAQQQRRRLWMRPR